MERERRERGRKRLMLRLPDLRRRLATAAGTPVEELFEAYDVAVSALEGYRQGVHQTAFETEYRAICVEIEDDIAALLTMPRYLQR